MSQFGLSWLASQHMINVFNWIGISLDQTLSSYMFELQSFVVFSMKTAYESLSVKLNTLPIFHTFISYLCK